MTTEPSFTLITRKRIPDREMDKLVKQISNALKQIAAIPDLEQWLADQEAKEIK